MKMVVATHYETITNFSAKLVWNCIQIICSIGRGGIEIHLYKDISYFHLLECGFVLYVPQIYSLLGNTKRTLSTIIIKTSSTSVV